ncbi:MAG: T9SS type A sorting domain-containing protein, partial [Bacteroidia bacterium]|nr:T9SS type A sorting domain-containing protein [Bacteroidia bacterium]
GLTYKYSNNTATHTVPNGSSSMCDSVVTLDLTLNHSTTGTDVVTACDSFTWIDGITYKYSNNTATHTIVNGNSSMCDSVVTLDLTINTVSDKSISKSGATLTASNASASYVWLDCGDNYSEIVGETNQSFTATADGDYAVELTENNCVDTSDCVTIMLGGIEKTSFTNNFKIYPNPSNGKFFIEFESMQSTISVAITTVSGQIVQESTYENVQDINLEITEPVGIYILEITDADDTNTVTRIMKR